jgi:hypothetical protein
MRRTGAVALLGAACTAWAAVPLRGTGEGGVLLVVAAACCVLAGAIRVLRKDAAEDDRGVFPGALANFAEWAEGVLVAGQWETFAAIAMVVLETLHPSRPWHTGLLAIGIVSYLLAVHRAEAVVPAAVFRGQARVLVASLALLVGATGVAMIPAARTGTLPVWLEVLAALAAMAAAALALPL